MLVIVRRVKLLAGRLSGLLSGSRAASRARSRPPIASSNSLGIRSWHLAQVTTRTLDLDVGTCAMLFLVQLNQVIPRKAVPVMYEITAIQVSSQPLRLEAIKAYYFQGRNGEDSIWVGKPDAVAFVRKNPNATYTSGTGGSKTNVEVVEATPPYLRTKPNETTKDNLLSLPVY